MQYTPVQYSKVQYSTVQYSTVQYSTARMNVGNRVARDPSPTSSKLSMSSVSSNLHSRIYLLVMVPLNSCAPNFLNASYVPGSTMEQRTVQLAGTFEEFKKWGAHTIRSTLTCKTGHYVC